MGTDIKLTKKIGVKNQNALITADASNINFEGSGVTATAVGTAVTVTITGGGGGGGATNLSYVAAVNNGTVTSDTGTDAIIPLAGAINAGLFSATEKTKLAGIAAGAEVNVNADWNATSGDAEILNKPTSLPSSFIEHDVKYGVAFTKGQAAYVSGSDGTNMIVSKADYSNEATSSKTMGLIITSGALNFQGKILTEGLLTGTGPAPLNTIGANAGDPVWLGDDGNLLYGLANKPIAPNHIVFIGIVTRINATNGEIFVKVQNGYELEELHNVLINGTLANNNILAYESSSLLWKNKTIAAVLGYTAENIANKTTNFTTVNDTLYPSVKAVDDHINSKLIGLWDDRGSYDASVNLFPSTGGSGTAGAIMKGDIWTINVQGTLGGTLMHVGDTVRALVDSPAQTTANWALLENAIGYVPENVTNKVTTFAGNTASDILYPSVKAIVDNYNSTNIKSIIGAASASQDGYLTSANWSTFNGKQNAITLTTTGTSGVATLVGSTLNVPNYTFTPVNIYNTNGTLTDNRTVSLSFYNLIFQGASAGQIVKTDLTNGGIFNNIQSQSYQHAENISLRVEQIPSIVQCYLSINHNSIQLQMLEANTNYIGFVINTLGILVNQKYYLPSGDGTANQVITTNGAGVLSWTSPTGITLTTSGTTGPATLVGTTLNVPNYSSGTTVDPYVAKANYTFRGIVINNNSTTIGLEGGVTMSTSASILAQAVINTNFASKHIRARYYGSTVSAGRYSGTRGTSQLWFLGAGFLYTCDFSISDTAYGATCQQFYGMQGSVQDLAYGGASLLAVNSIVNCIGVGSDAADTNLQIFHNDATGTCTKVNLGVAFPANRTSGAISTTVYTVLIYNGPSSSDVHVKVINNETGVSVENLINTNLPASSLGLNFYASRAMGAGVTNTGQFDLSKLGVYSIL